MLTNMWGKLGKLSVYRLPQFAEREWHHGSKHLLIFHNHVSVLFITGPSFFLTVKHPSEDYVDPSYSL